MYTRIKKRQGFSLSELMVAITIFTVVSTGATLSFSMGIRAYRQAMAETDASVNASTTLSRIASGIGDSCGLRAAFIPVTTFRDNNGWLITFTVPKGLSGSDVQVNKLHYDKSAKTVSIQAGNVNTWHIIGKNIVDSTISASELSVHISVTAKAVVGYDHVTSTKSSTISFRN